jgi:catechol 2,3-dioxygenase-like lactoylglutathione lyase family enzyme/ketosteroid isomerase-like protein
MTVRPQLTGLCLLTDDVVRLSHFYAEIFDTETAGDDTFATVTCPGAELSFFSWSGMEHMAPGSRGHASPGAFTLEVEVEDVDAWHARLEALATAVVKPPTTQPWGRRSVWFRDPDGNLVNFYAPVPARSDPERIVRTYFHRLLVQRDLDVCNELLAPDYVDHDAPPGSPPGPAATRAYVEEMLRVQPDLHFEVEECLARGRTVALRAVWRSAAVSQRGMVFLHVNDAGQITERLSTYAPLERGLEPE